MISIFISILASTFLCLFFNLKLSNFQINFQLNKLFLYKCINYGVKSWFGNVSSLANDMLDQLLLGFLTTAESLGLYSVSYNTQN